MVLVQGFPGNLLSINPKKNYWMLCDVDEFLAAMDLTLILGKEHASRLSAEKLRCLLVIPLTIHKTPA